jgi:hypothetical protein
MKQGKDLSDSMEECLVVEGNYSRRYAKTLVPKHSREAERMLDRFLNGCDLLSNLETILTENLHLDMNWVIAGSCLSAQEIATKKKAQELGIAISYTDRTGRPIYKNTIQLLEEIDRLSGRKKPSKLRIAQAYSDEYRNEVIHNGAVIDQRTAKQLLDVTNDLILELTK